MLRPYRAAEALVAPPVREVGDMTVEAASFSAFVRTLPAALARIAPSHESGLYAAHVHGEMDHQLRARILSRLSEQDNGLTVISSAKCLSEGVDLPAVDAVLFAHPKKSAVDITQAVGRALRRDPHVTGPSTIILPLVVPDVDGEIGDLDPGDYETLWQVVRALRAHDESLGIMLDGHRTNTSRNNPQLPDKITFVLPDGTSQNFIEQMVLLLVRQTTSLWWEGYHAAARYYESAGHLRVPAEHQSADGLRLGHWIAQRRHDFRRHLLSPERVQKLNEIGMVWNPAADAFAAYLASAAAFRAEQGHLRIPQSYATDEGMNLGRWLGKQRDLHRAGRLVPERANALDQLGIEWSVSRAEEAWASGLEAARLYFHEHRHLNVPRDYQTPSGHKLGDWLNTQLSKHNKGTLPADRKSDLDELGMIWDKAAASWQQSYAEALAYHAENGHLQVPHTYTTPDGIKLGSWILHQRQLHRGVKKGGISAERIAALTTLGMRW